MNRLWLLLAEATQCSNGMVNRKAHHAERDEEACEHTRHTIGGYCGRIGDDDDHCCAKRCERWDAGDPEPRRRPARSHKSAYRNAGDARMSQSVPARIRIQTTRDPAGVRMYPRPMAPRKTTRAASSAPEASSSTGRSRGAQVTVLRRPSARLAAAAGRRESLGPGSRCLTMIGRDGEDRVAGGIDARLRRPAILGRLGIAPASGNGMR